MLNRLSELLNGSSSLELRGQAREASRRWKPAASLRNLAVLNSLAAAPGERRDGYVRLHVLLGPHARAHRPPGAAATHLSSQSVKQGRVRARACRGLREYQLPPDELAPGRAQGLLGTCAFDALQGGRRLVVPSDAG